MSKDNDIKVINGKDEDGNGAEIFVSKDKKQNRITICTFDDKVYLTAKETKELIETLKKQLLE